MLNPHISPWELGFFSLLLISLSSITVIVAIRLCPKLVQKAVVTPKAVAKGAYKLEDKARAKENLEASITRGAMRN